MKRLRRTLRLAALAGLIASSAAVAQNVAPDRDPIEAQLRAVNGSLQEIVALLRAQVDAQRAGLAVQRLDIARREVVSLEREVHQARAERDSREQDQSRLVAQREAIDAELEDEDETQRDRLQRQFEIEFQGMEDALFRLDQRILDLEGRLQRAREDLMIWEEVVADTLQ